MPAARKSSNSQTPPRSARANQPATARTARGHIASKVSTTQQKQRRTSQAEQSRSIGTALAALAGPAEKQMATRQRLIEVAGEVFAQEGFRMATVREICTKAGANVAAVNYHFGDKAGLYSAVMKYSLELGHLQYPVLQVTGLTSRERLTRFIHRLLAKMLDDGRPAWHGKLMTREMVEPTAALGEMVEQAIVPTYRVLAGIVSDIMGLTIAPDARIPHDLPENLRWMCNSIIGQCLMYKHCQPVIQILQLGHDHLFSTPQRPHHTADKSLAIARLAEHIAAFSLGGVTLAGENGEHKS
jgi:AcrR family transcriptional regulator